MTGKDVCRGSISVFFALLLTTVLAVVLTSLESARHAALSYLTAQAGEAALESAFAGYYRPLWERYHLLFMADGPGLVPALRDTLSCYEEPEGDGSIQGVNLYAFRTEDATIRETVTATDLGGEAFLQGIVEDVENHGMTALAESLIGQAELVGEAETVSGYIGSLSEYEKQVSDLEEAYGAMEGQGRRLRKTYEGLEEALHNGTLTEENGRALLEEAKSLASETLRQTEESYGKVLAGAERLKGDLEEEGGRLLEQKGKVGEATYAQMEAEFENLTEYTREDGSRRNAVEHTRELLTECAGELSGVKAWQDGAASEELKAAIKKGSEALEEFQEESAVKRQKSELLETVKAWKDSGILGLVLEDAEAASDKRLSDESRPSKALREGEDTERTASAPEKGAVVLYGVSHFGYFGEEREEAALAYEVEYILGGGESDRENLATAAGRLLSVRSGMNFMYLLTDSQKQAEAEALAAALVGFTGIYPLVKFVKGILLGAWAFAEAVCDVRTLYQGGQVPLVKTERDWKLSLEGAAAADTCETGARKEDGMWDYEGYLGLLLLMGNTQSQCFRMMDLIEADLRRTDSGFFMENCISYALAEFHFRAEPLFFPVPFLGNSGYAFLKTSAYGYYEPSQQTE